jgi:hypothetical protein
MESLRAYARPIVYGLMFGILPEGAADAALMVGRVSTLQSKCIKQVVAIGLLSCLYQNHYDVIKVVGITQFSYLFSHVLKTSGVPETQANTVGHLLRMIGRYGNHLMRLDGLAMILLGMLAGQLGHYIEKSIVKRIEHSHQP